MSAVPRRVPMICQARRAARGVERAIPMLLRLMFDAARQDSLFDLLARRR